MFMALAQSVIVGGAAVYAANAMMESGTYKAADSNMQTVYKYGAAGGGALAAGLLLHMVFGAKAAKTA